MLPDDFLQILACPKCKGPLEYRHTGDPKDHALICRACALVYPIDEDDIPDLIIEDAKPLSQEGARP